MPRHDTPHNRILNKMDSALARVKSRRNNTVLPLEAKRTFVDSLLDKREWIREELAFRHSDASAMKWKIWARARLEQIEAELELFS